MGLEGGWLLSARFDKKRTSKSPDTDLPKPKRNQRKRAKYQYDGQKHPLALACESLQEPANKYVHRTMLHGVSRETTAGTGWKADSPFSGASCKKAAVQRLAKLWQNVDRKLCIRGKLASVTCFLVRQHQGAYLATLASGPCWPSSIATRRPEAAQPIQPQVSN